MADYTPVYAAGLHPFTMSASAAVTGGQLVEGTTASSVGPAGAASTKVVGVAAFDQPTVGGRVTVWPLANVTHEITSTGTIALGDGIAAGAAGVAASVAVATGAAAGTLVGTATTAATGGAKVRFVGRG